MHLYIYIYIYIEMCRVGLAAVGEARPGRPARHPACRGGSEGISRVYIYNIYIYIYIYTHVYVYIYIYIYIYDVCIYIYIYTQRDNLASVRARLASSTAKSGCPLSGGSKGWGHVKGGLLIMHVFIVANMGGSKK